MKDYFRWEWEKLEKPHPFENQELSVGEAEELWAKVCRQRHWRHRIPVGSGWVTPGTKHMNLAYEEYGLPEDVWGESVLSVGAMDGGFGILAKLKGASSVSLLDVWDVEAMRDRWGDLVAGQVLNPALAARLLGVDVEMINQRVQALEGSSRRWDTTFALGLLYHVENPRRVLQILRDCTRGRLVLESACLPGEGRWVYYLGDGGPECENARWFPTRSALVQMLEDTGWDVTSVEERGRVGVEKRMVWTSSDEEWVSLFEGPWGSRVIRDMPGPRPLRVIPVSHHAERLRVEIPREQVHGWVDPGDVEELGGLASRAIKHYQRGGVGDVVGAALDQAGLSGSSAPETDRVVVKARAV